ncbi:MAG: DegT/DnrJ/EryC1/StrS family aminotransferase [Vicinamibacterales bacterium]|jgi:dTDP-4-amino-4,6-dideoxygalactose transaminase|nr:DegT/DnrJ/EryC1/StrS family aminotransferase [Vicinamibacterales bacterium]
MAATDTGQASATMQVPMLDLQAQYRPIRDAVIDVVTRVCDSQRFIMGPEVEAMERDLAACLGVTHAVGVSSGTDALLLAMMALGIGPGDEVITSTYSFFATAGCVARLGGKPVFVDIDPVTYNIDPAATAAAVTSRTRAIIPVHLYGQSADLDPLIAIAKRAGVPLIEDAAQAIGATYKGRMVGGFGRAGCFSFFPSKNLGAFGDGGLVTTNDDTVAASLRRMRVHGADRQYYHQVIGGNFRLDALQAAVLRVKLPHLAGWTEARRRNAARYDDLFADAGLTGRVTLPVSAPDRRHIFNQYVIRVPQRDAVKAHLESRHVGCAIYYPVPFHEQACFAYLGYRTGQFPQAELAARETLALPIYGELTAEQQRYVVSVLAEALSRTT